MVPASRPRSDFGRGTATWDRVPHGLENHALQLSPREGQWLFRQGERVNRFYLASSGRLGLLRLSPDGSEKLIEIVTPGICRGG
ncbi:MAG TPA: cyclic nucleotide-binding domain-containing protein [Chromatiaceae bacterium]|nr:cyclic nucleotide-binding domain-containing protein [Chromatiaceae bacterium]